MSTTLSKRSLCEDANCLVSNNDNRKKSRRDPGTVCRLDNFQGHFEYCLDELFVTALQSDTISREVQPVSCCSSGVGAKFYSLKSSNVNSPLPASSTDLKEENVRKILLGNVQSRLTPLQKDLFGVMNCYVDLLFPNRSAKNDEEVTQVICLHALNHTLKTRKRILQHNAKLKEARDEKAENSEFRDQGLVRPKVLILVPFRDSALRLVQRMIELLLGNQSKGTREYVANKKRFLSEFKPVGPSPVSWSEKPTDFQTTFRGNTDDCFRIGLSVAKKSLKLYEDFYSADIIIASPLGLRMIVGAEAETTSEYDFLSSIEILFLDQADVLLMQNWQQVLHVLEALNKKPKEQHGTDYSRVRLWALNEWSKYYRQTVLFSQLAMPEFNSLFGKYCLNYAGLAQFAPTERGLTKICAGLPQAFQRFACRNPTEEADRRFLCFLQRVLPQYTGNSMGHTLIYVSSYYDYVRLRNHFKKETISFVQLCEYSKNKKISRARDLFYHGKKQFLLLSERFHFYRRYTIRGIHHLIFYQLPVYDRFFFEFCNMVKQSIESEPGLIPTCTVIFSRYDALRMNRIVGHETTRTMLESETQTFTMESNGE